MKFLRPSRRRSQKATQRNLPRWIRWGGVPVALFASIFILLIGYRSAYAAYQAYMGQPPDQIHFSWADDPATTLTVMWRTRRDDTPSLLRYRAVGDEDWTMAVGMPHPSGTVGVLHQATLRNLEPDTDYEYIIRGDYYNTVWSDVTDIHTAPPRGVATDFDFIYVADTGLIGRKDGLATGTKQVIDEIAAIKPILLLAGGDYAYYNTDARYGTLDKSIDAWFNQMMPIAIHTPIMPTYGNHEALLRENFGPWVQRFATPEGFDHRRNYSFDVSNVHFVSIFAIYEEQGLTPEALAWIEQDIVAAQESGQQWIIPFMHVSPFAEGKSHPSNLALREQLGPLFERLGVKVVLTAHDQAYERTYPLRDVPETNQPTSDSKSCYTMDDGVTWVKASPGGKKSNKSNDFSIFENPPSPWVAFRDNTVHVFTHLTVSAAGMLTVETYGLEGNGDPATVIDLFSYSQEGGCT